jgi:hypothetical protein
MNSCPSGHVNDDSVKACAVCGALMPPQVLRAQPTVAPAVSQKPVALWRRVAPIAAGVLIGGFLVVGQFMGDSDNNDGGRPASSSVIITIDKCRFSDGWVDAGGFVTNNGSEATNVLVNVSLNGRYLDRDYVYGIEPGQRTSWSISEQASSGGTCTAERG